MTPVTINPTGFLANFIVFFLRGDSSSPNKWLLERWGVYDTCTFVRKLMKALFVGAFFSTLAFAYGFCSAFFLKGLTIFYMTTGVFMKGSVEPFAGTMFEIVYIVGCITVFVTGAVLGIFAAGVALIYIGSEIDKAIRRYKRTKSETPPSVLSQLIAAKREKICRPVKFVDAK